VRRQPPSLPTNWKCFFGCRLQDHLHERFGGVVPEIASRAHVERILPVIDEALRKAGVTLADLDAIAVANTPGLAGSLLVGLTAAKGIALACGLPLVAINHLQAHIYACRLASGRDVFPCIGLVVSGGHSNFTAVPARPTSLPGRNDRRCGRGVRQVASLLGLPYPGGPPSNEPPVRKPGWHRFHGRYSMTRSVRFQLQWPQNGGTLSDSLR
jgi:N6-L-threonylcarbamoyladenine synthase